MLGASEERVRAVVGILLLMRVSKQRPLIGDVLLGSVAYDPSDGNLLLLRDFLKSTVEIRRKGDRGAWRGSGFHCSGFPSFCWHVLGLRIRVAPPYTKSVCKARQKVIGSDSGDRVKEKPPPSEEGEGFLWLPSRGLLNRRRLELLQEVSGALRMGGGGEDGAFVVLEDLEPVAEIGGMVFPDVGCDAEVGAEESGTEFRNQLLAGIAFIAEALAAQVTGKTCVMLGPV